MMNFYGEQDMVRSSDEFENGCINALHRADGDLTYLMLVCMYKQAALMHYTVRTAI